jgi:dephospho-CoA kinase
VIIPLDDNPQKQGLAVGLTGGIATGKSAVVNIFTQHGLPVLQADQVGHEVLRSDPIVHSALRDMFGDEAFLSPAQVNRQWLAKQLFHDEEIRRALEALLHPLIKARCLQEMKLAWSQGESIFVIEAALLVEVNWLDLFDVIVLVDCPLELRIARLVARDHIDKKYASEKIASQLPMDSKRAVADYIIRNDSTLEVLASRTSELINILCDEGL